MHTFHLENKKPSKSSSSQKQSNEKIVGLVGQEPESPNQQPVNETPAQRVEEAPEPTNVATCTPVGLSRSDYLAISGTSTDNFGYTVLEGSQMTFPQVQLEAVGRRFRLRPTTAALPAIPSYYTEASMFNEGHYDYEGDRLCPAGRYDKRWSITTSGAEKIREGEQEHCQDFQYAFDISLKRYRDEVNRVAASRRRFRSQEQAEAYLEQQTGMAPADWNSEFERLAGLTRLRDTRNWHNPIIRPSLDHRRCNHVRINLTGRSFPQIGRYPSSDIIR